MALKASDRDTALWIEISRQRAIAINRGEPPPEFYKIEIVPFDPPPGIKAPGRKERKAKAATS